jgi:hypothetical protein
VVTVFAVITLLVVGFNFLGHGSGGLDRSPVTTR